MATQPLAELRRRHTEIRTRLRTINDAHHDGNLGDDGAEWTRLDGEASTIEAAMTRQQRLDDLDRSAAATPVHGSGDAGFDALAAQVTAMDVIRAQLPGVNDAAAGRAREVSAELARRSGRQPEGLFFSMRLSGVTPEQRVFTTTLPGGGPGSNLIQTDIATYLIDRLRERLIVRRLGATILSGLQGNLSIPRLKASTTAYWVPENGAITASDPQVDQVSFTPKHVGGITELSRNMLMQPSVDVARMVEDDMAKNIARALDSAALVGGGAGQPSGLLAPTSGIGNVPLATNGGPPTWNSIVSLIAAIDIANALDGALGFAGNGRVTSVLRRTLKSATDTSSNFVLQDPTSLAGYPLQSSQLVPSNLTKGTGTNLSALIFGDWSMLVMGFWSELDLLVNPFVNPAYSSGNVQLRSMATADIEIRQPLAFAAITDMVTT
jgi:HK97 family phage major capsid protein